MDGKSAYSNAIISYEIYVEQPEGFIIKNENSENYSLKIVILLKGKWQKLELVVTCTPD